MIRPLQVNVDIEYFEEPVRLAEIQLRSGHLRNAWEVLIALVWTGRVRFM